MKTISYEVFEEGVIPRNIFVPVGSGGLYLGIYNGFLDLLNMGLIDEIPRIHSVEAAGYERIYVKRNGKERYPEMTSRLADGLRVPGPPRIDEIYQALRRCGGETFVVNDEEIKAALKKLYKIGLFVEPTSATAYAAYMEAIEDKVIGKDEEVLIPLTGSGFKAIDKLKNIFVKV